MDFDDDNYSTDSSEARERGKEMICCALEMSMNFKG